MDKENPVNQEMRKEDSRTDYSEDTPIAEWVEILALGVHIGVLAHLDNKVTVESAWEYVHGIGWNTLPDKKGLFLHFYEANDAPLVSYMLIPHQKLFKDKPGSTGIVPADSFYTVTEHALVFGPLFRKNSTHNQDLIDKVDEIMSYTMFKKIHNERQSDKAEAPIPHSLQIMSLKVFPYYMLMDVALPGSSLPADEKLLELSGNRLIRLSLIPDTGDIVQRWISPPPGKEQIPEIADLRSIIEDELETFLKDAQNHLLDPSNSDVRLEIFNSIMKKGEKILTTHDNDKKYVKLILRLLALDQSFGSSYGLDYGEMFPDYEPKMSPDTILDYRGELWEIFGQFPDSSLENLTSLITLHDEYKDKVKANPGTWEQGNMILGGPEKEYIPSNEELLLSEIDERIIHIVNGTEAVMLEKYTKEHNLTGKILHLISIEIWHADVMGSGRFFYASQPRSYMLTL